jgi:hypothetical protein
MFPRVSKQTRGWNWPTPSALKKFSALEKGPKVNFLICHVYLSSSFQRSSSKITGSRIPQEFLKWFPLSSILNKKG